MAGRRLQRLPWTRVEPAPNSKYAPISEMLVITHDYGNFMVIISLAPPQNEQINIYMLQ